MWQNCSLQWASEAESIRLKIAEINQHVSAQNYGAAHDVLDYVKVLAT